MGSRWGAGANGYEEGEMRLVERLGVEKLGRGTLRGIGELRWGKW
jgi:hypothetical protein